MKSQPYQTHIAYWIVILFIFGGTLSLGSLRSYHAEMENDSYLGILPKAAIGNSSENILKNLGPPERVFPKGSEIDLSHFRTTSKKESAEKGTVFFYSSRLIGYVLYFNDENYLIEINMVRT